MLVSKSTTIGEYTYTVTSLPARKGRSVAVRLARLLAPVTRGGAENAQEGGVAALLEGISDEDLAVVCDEFARCTVTQGEGKAFSLYDQFDLHFAAKYGEMVRWLQFCIEVNFGSFLGEVGVALPAVGTPAKAA